MPYGLTEFRQDIDEVKRVLDRKELDQINILGNRITSNAFLLNGSKYGLPGFMIKDLTILVGPRKELIDTNLTAAISSFRLFLKQLEELDLDLKDTGPKLWGSYTMSLKLIRKTLISEDAHSPYSEENNSLTKEGFQKIVEIIRSNMELFSSFQNRLIMSAVTETNRLYLAYGIDEEIAKFRLLFVVLGQVNNYSMREWIDQSSNESPINLRIISFVNKILEIIDSDNSNSESVENLLWEMISFWRELFMKYNEPFEPYEKPGESDKITLNDEIKDKLRDLISRSLEKEIRKTK
jgi:hypothetical protein